VRIVSLEKFIPPKRKKTKSEIRISKSETNSEKKQTSNREKSKTTKSEGACLEFYLFGH
jgi:hypothetical protein